MKISLEGKVAIVSGGTAGIGECICRSLTDAGCKVATNYRNEERAQKWRDKNKQDGYDIAGYQADASDYEASQAFVDAVTQDVLHDPSLTVPLDEDDGLDLLAPVGIGRRQHFDLFIAGQLGIQLIFGFEVFESVGNGMLGVFDVHFEFTIGAVAADSLFPDSTKQHAILFPFLKRTASEVQSHDVATALHIVL